MVHPNKPTIGIDLMGGDNAPASLLDTLRPFANRSDVSLLAIGPPECAYNAPCRYHLATECIAMEDPPLMALRKKKEASLFLGLRLLKEGAIDALVSTGNTGALVAASTMILSTYPRVLRPAFLALMPTKKRPVAILDVGANVQVKTAHLIQFALLSIAYLQARGLEHPTIGILNIGSEALKGTSELRLAYRELQELEHQGLFRFAGNIEGKSAFDGEVDALITDGFTGNVFLKTAEGIASLLLDRIEASRPKGEKLPWLETLHCQLHYAEYPGALLAGVKGIVIKCHGYASLQSFASGIQGAIELATSHFLDRFQEKLGKLEKELLIHYHRVRRGKGT